MTPPQRGARPRPGDRAAVADQRLGSPSAPSDGLPEPDGELLTGGAWTGFGVVVFVGVDAFGLVTVERCGAAGGGGGGGVTVRCGVGVEDRVLAGAELPFVTLATWLDDAGLEDADDL
jgi:hypothetical protein